MEVGDMLRVMGRDGVDHWPKSRARVDPVDPAGRVCGALTGAAQSESEFPDAELATGLTTSINLILKHRSSRTRSLRFALALPLQSTHGYHGYRSHLSRCETHLLKQSY